MLSWVSFSGLDGTCIYATSKWNLGATHGDLGFLLSLWLPPLPSSLFSLIVASACLGSLLPTLGLCPLCPGGHFPAYAFCLYHPLFERRHPIFRTSPIAPPGPALAPASPTSALGTASMSSSVFVFGRIHLRHPPCPWPLLLPPRQNCSPFSATGAALDAVHWRLWLIWLEASDEFWAPSPHPPVPPQTWWLTVLSSNPPPAKKVSSWLLSNQEEEDEERWPWL